LKFFGVRLEKVRAKRTEAAQKTLKNIASLKNIENLQESCGAKEEYHKA
jgi:hypothetical protein